MTSRPSLTHANFIDVAGPGLHTGHTLDDRDDFEGMPLLGTGGSIDRMVCGRPAQVTAPPTLICEVAGPFAWRGAPRNGARREPRPFTRYFGPQLHGEWASAPKTTQATMTAHLQAPALVPTQDDRSAPSLVANHAAVPGPAAKPQQSVPALQIASGAHASAGSPARRSTPPAVLPSFALHGYEDVNSALPAISSPLVSVSISAQARATGFAAPTSAHCIYHVAAHQSARALQYYLSVQPTAVMLWHPQGYNLLHHVVRLRSVEHVEVVLQTIGHLALASRQALLDGVAQDGLDAVRIAVKQRSAFVLAKLLEAGCDPTRQRYRNKPWLIARLSRPLQPYWRIEDAALYAMRKGNVDAVDLLLLWDERRVVHVPESRYAFDLEALMGMATSVDVARLRDAMFDVLHAARRRRPQRYSLHQLS